MISFHSSDVIFATVRQRGNVILSMQLSGIGSYAQLICHLRKLLAGLMGIATLDLRNGTQGWSQSRPVMLAA